MVPWLWCTGTIRCEVPTVWGDIWNRTAEKSQTHATNVIMHPFGKAVWGDIWNHTLEKSQRNSTNVIVLPFGRALWGDISNRTAEKSQTHATNVILHPFVKPIWGDIWFDYAICILSSRKFLFRQVILWGHIFCSYIQVLGIRYFQRSCATYLCLISVILVGHVLCPYIQVLGIRYFRRPCASYIDGVVSFVLIYKY